MKNREKIAPNTVLFHSTQIINSQPSISIPKNQPTDPEQKQNPTDPQKPKHSPPKVKKPKTMKTSQKKKIYHVGKILSDMINSKQSSKKRKKKKLKNSLFTKTIERRKKKIE